MDRADAIKTDRPVVLLVSAASESLPVVEEALSTLDVDVALASSEEDALGKLEQCALLLAVIDLGSQDSAGADLADDSRLARPAVPWQNLRGYLETQLMPVVFLAEPDCDLSDILRARAASPVDVVVKPLTTAMLRNRISLLLDLGRKSALVDQQARQLASASQILQEMATSDPLTGTLNRRGLSETLGRESLRLCRDGSPLVAVLVDLDDFRDLNAEHGNGVGDAVLSEIASTLRTALRRTDYIARVGGDQFLVLLPDTRPAEGAMVAEKLRTAVEQVVVLTPRGPVSVTASLAATKLRSAEASVEDLLDETARLMRPLKVSGKNRVVTDFAVHGSGRPLGTELADLADALRSGSCLRVARRPIVCLSDRKLVGFGLECRCTTEGFEEPASYLKVASDADISTAVDRQCLSLAAEAAKQVPAELQCHVSASLSSVVTGLATDALGALAAERGHTRVELCEQDIVGAPDRLGKAVEALKAVGVGLVLSGVGYGRTSLESLLVLGPELVKLDEFLLAGPAELPPARQQALGRALRIADALDCKVIADGIGSDDEADACKAHGIEYGQGSLWGAG